MNKQLELFPNLKFPKPKVSELKKMVLYRRIKEVVENVKKIHYIKSQGGK